MQKQESLEKTSVSIDRQTTFLEWDGKQKSLEDYVDFIEPEERLDEKDEIDCSYEQVYKSNRVKL
jgi:hypothetical protein